MFLFFLCCPAFDASPSGGEGQWKISEPFPAGSLARHCAGRSDIGSWRIVKRKGSLVFSLWRPEVETSIELPFAATLNSVSSTLQVSDGYLIGTNRGEWGGELWWFDNSGERKRQLFDKNITGIHRIGEEVVALSGLAHLSVSFGSLLIIEKDHQSAQWEVSENLQLLAAPEASALDSQEKNLWISTSLGLQSFKKRQLIIEHSSDLSSLYPDSMGISDLGEVYVGMRHAVVRYSPLVSGGFREDWLVPASCTSFDLDDDGQCKCLTRPQLSAEIQVPTHESDSAVPISKEIVALGVGLLVLLGGYALRKGK